MKLCNNHQPNREQATVNQSNNVHLSFQLQNNMAMEAESQKVSALPSLPLPLCEQLFQLTANGAKVSK